jgi:hypothetical protein
MKITPIESSNFGFLVTSTARLGVEYRVDLTDRVDSTGRAHGSCTCKHYSTQALPNYKRDNMRRPYKRDNGRVDKATTECKHIAACNAYDHWHTVMKMRAAVNKQS